TGLPRGEQVTIAVHPQRPRTVYAAVSGAFGPAALYRSEDGFESWLQTEFPQGATEVRQLAIDPSLSSTMYAATSAGLCKSSDAGCRWTRVLGACGVDSFDRVVIDPAVPAVVYAAQFGGQVWKTVDAGAHWMQLEAPEAARGLVRGLAVNPRSPENLVMTLDRQCFYRRGGSGWQL